MELVFYKGNLFDIHGQNIKYIQVCSYIWDFEKCNEDFEDGFYIETISHLTMDILVYGLFIK